MLVYLRSAVAQFLSEQVHQILHEVALSHEQVLANAAAVAFELVLGEQDLEQLLVRHQVRVIHPVLQVLECLTRR